MTSLQWYLFGAWTVTGIVIAFELIDRHVKQKHERKFLDGMAKMIGLIPSRRMSNQELRDRIGALMRGPW